MEKVAKKVVKKAARKTKKIRPAAHRDSNLAKIEYRQLNFNKDIQSIKRIWREIAWATHENKEQAMDIIFAVDDTVVGCINGEPECSVLAQSGTMRLDETDLPLCVIAAVTTSRIGRGQGFAQNLTAWQLAAAQKRALRLPPWVCSTKGSTTKWVLVLALIPMSSPSTPVQLMCQ